MASRWKNVKIKPSQRSNIRHLKNIKMMKGHWVWFSLIVTIPLGIATASFFFLCGGSSTKNKENKKGIKKEENEIIHYVFKELEERDKKLYERDKKLDKLQQKIEDLKNNLMNTQHNLMNTQHSLHTTTIDYLQKIGAMHGKGVLVMFQRRFVDSQSGSMKDKWTRFLISKDPTAVNVMTELSANQISADKAARIATDLCNKMPNIILNTLTAADSLYLIRDELPPDQLAFMVAIAKHVIAEIKVKVISKTEWQALVDSSSVKNDAPSHDKGKE